LGFGELSYIVMKLSIVIPVYNAAATLPRTLKSLEHIAPGHRQDVQIILVNDGSSDESLSIGRQFEQGGLFPATQVVDQPNAGSSAARNAGLEQADGVWILFLDDDDELGCDPMIVIDQADDDTTAIGFSVQISKQQKRRAPMVTPRNHLDIFTAVNALTISSVVFRKDRIQNSFDVSLMYLEDWDFWLRNPDIFERMQLFNQMDLAAIHAISDSKTDQHHGCGECRTRIAKSLLEERGDQLTRRQRNNLGIQAHIGRLQSDGGLALRPFFIWPCNLTLWAKLLTYSLLRNKITRFMPLLFA